MDMETMRRLEKEADERDQTAAVLEHWKRKADRRRFWAFCLNWRQIVDEPVAAVPTPGAQAPNAPLGVGSGEAGSEPTSQPPVTTQGPGGARRFVGPAGPTTLTVRPVQGEGPATPPHA